MSEKAHTEAEQADNNAGGAIQAVTGDVEWAEYGAIALGVLGGLLVNALAVVAITGGNLGGLSDGLLVLAPLAVLAAAVHHRHDPVDLPVISPALMFVTILLANTASLLIRAFRSMPMVDPVTSSLILAMVAALFTPGPFIGAWAVKRWWL